MPLNDTLRALVLAAASWPTAIAAAQPAPPSQALGTTTLTDGGAEPRRVMAYRPSAGWAGDYELVTRITPRVLLDGAEQPTPPASLIITPIRFQVEQVTERSHVVIGTMGKPRVAPAQGTNPQQAAAVEQAVAAAEGGRIVLELSSRGELLQSSVLNADNLPKGGRELLNHAVSLMSTALVPLPDEAVGRGARVRIDQPVKAEQLDLALTQLLEFPAALPSGLQMKARLSTVMAPIQDSGPDRPQKASIEGTVTLDMLTNRPLPVQLIAAVTRSVTREITDQGATRSLQTIMTTELNLREVVQPSAVVRNPGEPAPAVPGAPSR